MMQTQVFSFHSLLWFLVLTDVTVSISHDDFIWRSVPIGGGGFVTGIEQTSNHIIYARTDVSGVFRFDEETPEWVQLFNWISNKERNLYGFEAIISHPNVNKSNQLWVASGMYTWRDTSYIMTTNNNGDTWHKYLDFTNDEDNLISAGNSNYRHSGPRFAFGGGSGGDDSILYYGTRRQGLLYTFINETDVLLESMNSNNGDEDLSGFLWDRIDSYPNYDASSSNNIGIMFIAVNTQNTNIIATFLFNFGIVYSTDSGKSWTTISDTNSWQCIHGKFDKNNILYLSCYQGVYMINFDYIDHFPNSNSLINISPDGNPYAGLEVSLNDEILVVSTFDTSNFCGTKFYYTNLSQFGDNTNWRDDIGQYGNISSLSFNWFEIQQSNFYFDAEWYSDGKFACAVSDLQCDNRYDNCQRLIFGDWYVIWFNDNIFSNNPSDNLWYTMEAFHESTVVFNVKSPSRPPDDTNNTKHAVLMTGVADVAGYVW